MCAYLSHSVLTVGQRHTIVGLTGSAVRPKISVVYRLCYGIFAIVTKRFNYRGSVSHCHGRRAGYCATVVSCSEIFIDYINRWRNASKEGISSASASLCELTKCVHQI